LLEGRWDEERFIVLEPGQTFRMTADERVMEPAGTGISGSMNSPLQFLRLWVSLRRLPYRSSGSI
jgi:hypothetical protein